MVQIGDGQFEPESVTVVAGVHLFTAMSASALRRFQLFGKRWIAGRAGPFAGAGGLFRLGQQTDDHPRYICQMPDAETTDSDQQSTADSTQRHPVLAQIGDDRNERQSGFESRAKTQSARAFKRLLQYRFLSPTSAEVGQRGRHRLRPIAAGIGRIAIQAIVSGCRKQYIARYFGSWHYSAGLFVILN